jgi:hypothetical protein
MDTLAAFIVIIVIGIFMFLPIRWVVRVTIYGKGFFFPNWARVDRMFWKKHSIWANYEESFWWKSTHYFFILMIVGSIFIVRFVIKM